MWLDTTTEFDYRLRLVKSRRTIRDTVQRAQRINLARKVAEQIAELGTDVLG